MNDPRDDRFIQKGAEADDDFVVIPSEEVSELDVEPNDPSVEDGESSS